MQTRLYSDLFKLISAMVGTGGELSDPQGEQNLVGRLINRRFQEAFDESPIWPRYLVPSEERDLVAINLKITNASGDVAGTDVSVINGEYNLLGKGKGTGAEAAGTLVYSHITNNVIVYNDRTGIDWAIDVGASAALQSDGTYVVTGSSPPEFFEGDTDKKTRVIDVETWTPGSGTPVSPTVSGKEAIQYEQTGKTNIGDFNRIHRKTAFVNNSAIEYDFYVDVNGANILNVVSTTDKTAFVTYKKQFIPFTTTSGYYSSTEEVPAEFFNFIAHAVYADFLRVQNRQQEAIAEEGVAKGYLALELEKIDIRSNNNTVNKRFSTYVNRQSR